MKRVCLSCEKELKGRVDQKYCNNKCRANEHRRRFALSPTQKKIHKILLTNHLILTEQFENYPRALKIKFSHLELTTLGFNFDYCTRIYLNSKNKLVHYIYDYRWIQFSDDNVWIYRKLKPRNSK